MITKAICKYCDNHLQFDLYYHYCENCNVKYISSRSVNDPEIIFVQFLIDDYLIELILDDQKCSLYKAIGNRYAKIISLSYLPDINPSNIKAWLRKMLKLKAFS